MVLLVIVVFLKLAVFIRYKLIAMNFSITCTDKDLVCSDDDALDMIFRGNECFFTRVQWEFVNLLNYWAWTQLPNICFSVDSSRCKYLWIFWGKQRQDGSFRVCILLFYQVFTIPQIQITIGTACNCDIFQKYYAIECYWRISWLLCWFDWFLGFLHAIILAVEKPTLECPLSHIINAACDKLKLVSRHEGKIANQSFRWNTEWRQDLEIFQRNEVNDVLSFLAQRKYNRVFLLFRNFEK